MRKGWEYKRLDECANIEYGTRVVQKKDSGTLYPVYGGGGETFRMDKFNREDCLIVARFAMSRRCVRFVNGKFFLNDSGLSVKAGDKLYQSYLNYNIISLNDDIYHLGKGAAQRNLDVKSFKKLTIAIPPQSTQLAIVSELDKINELIRLKKEQLKDFDNLAQSLFYEMFGDPVENEKGWEVKKLGEVCEVTSAKRVFIDEVVESGVPFIRGTELTALSKLVPGEKMDYTLFITYEHYERLKAITGVPKIGDLLIPSINADGIVWMVDTEDPLYFKDGRVLWVHVNHEYYNSIAIQKLMNVLIKNVFTSMGGATFAELKLFVLRNMNVPTPPLSVQDAFSEKIKQIDAQKLQVKKSIQDLETLLASRMQYWFE